MATGADLVRQARNYLGVPFAAGGRNAHGLDCGGLILRALADLELPVPEVPNYHAAFDGGCVAAYLEPFCERIDLYEPPSFSLGRHLRPGDLLIFSLAKGVQHLGIATNDGTFIHAWDSPSIHAVVEIGLDRFWQDRLLAVYRLRGLADG